MGRVVHFEIHADDMERAERFYTGVFGWEAMRTGGPIDYRLLRTGPPDQPGIDGAITPRRAPAEGVEALIAFVCTIAVENMDETVRRVTDAGGQQVIAPRSIPDVG